MNISWPTSLDKTALRSICVCVRICVRAWVCLRALSDFEWHLLTGLCGVAA